VSGRFSASKECLEQIVDSITTTEFADNEINAAIVAARKRLPVGQRGFIQHTLPVGALARILDIESVGSNYLNLSFEDYDFGGKFIEILKSMRQSSEIKFWASDQLLYGTLSTFSKVSQRRPSDARSKIAVGLDERVTITGRRDQIFVMVQYNWPIDGLLYSEHKGIKAHCHGRYGYDANSVGVSCGTVSIVGSTDWIVYFLPTMLGAGRNADELAERIAADVDVLDCATDKAVIVVVTTNGDIKWPQ
jgi:hypothetical protein